VIIYKNNTMLFEDGEKVRESDGLCSLVLPIIIYVYLEHNFNM
jgi:hypothetical protein